MCKCSGKCGCNITSTTKGEKGDASPEATLGYKVYKALISQVGTAAPTVKVLQNTIGTIVWTRFDVGEYYGTLAGAFTVDKTYFDVGQRFPEGIVYQPNGVDAVYIATLDSSNIPSDTILSDITVLIEVYP
jgi:hypothetical protein